MDSDSCTLTISGKGEMGDFTSSTQPWVAYRTSIKKIVVSSGVTSIGYSAFDGCTALTSVSLPDGLTKMGEYSFARCSSLTSVTIPGTMASGQNFSDIFYTCSSLQSFAISGSSTYYGTNDGVLYSKGETGLYELLFMPAGKTGAYTIPVTELTLPASLTLISSSAYTIWGSKYLQAFRVAEGNRYFSSVDGVLFNLNRTVLLAYPSGNSNPSYDCSDSVIILHSEPLW